MTPFSAFFFTSASQGVVQTKLSFSIIFAQVRLFQNESFVLSVRTLSRNLLKIKLDILEVVFSWPKVLIKDKVKMEMSKNYLTKTLRN